MAASRIAVRRKDTTQTAGFVQQPGRRGASMSPEVGTYLILCAFAFAAGAMNSVAGGGTLLTFPALMAAFAPYGDQAGAFANATSTVALLPGSFAGAWGYRAELDESRL